MGRSKMSYNGVLIWGLCFVVLLLLIDASVNAASGSNDKNGNGNGNNGNSAVSNDQNGKGNGNNGKNGDNGNSNGNGNGQNGNNNNGNNGNGSSNSNGNGNGNSDGSGNNGHGQGNGSSGNGTSDGNGSGSSGNGTSNGNGSGSSGNGTSNGNGSGSSGNGTSNGNGGGSSGNGTSNGNTSGEDPQTTKYSMIQSEDGSDVARCYANNNCNMKKLKCPAQCPNRVPSDSSKSACFIDCSTKCEATCKHRSPNCNGYSAVCYDPRFIGGDGVIFYFHGKAHEDFCLVSDHNLHINAHFIGLRPEGRTRDFTWVQTLGILYDGHKISIGAKSNVASWDDSLDQLEITYDGQDVSVPTVSGATWADSTIEIERLSVTNSAQLRVGDLLKLSVQVVPITEDENRVHRYGLPADDVFAHLNVQFNFIRYGDNVDGVLGQTYRPGYVSPVKAGTPMPVVGGEDKFRVTSLFTTDCLANQFINAAKTGLSNSNAAVDVSGPMVKTECASTFGAGGLLCLRR